MSEKTWAKSIMWKKYVYKINSLKNNESVTLTKLMSNLRKLINETSFLYQTFIAILIVW